MKILKVTFLIMIGILVLNGLTKVIDLIAMQGALGPVLAAIFLGAFAGLTCLIFSDKIVNHLKEGDE